MAGLMFDQADLGRAHCSDVDDVPFLQRPILIAFTGPDAIGRIASGFVKPAPRPKSAPKIWKIVRVRTMTTSLVDQIRSIKDRASLLAGRERCPATRRRLNL